MKIVCMLPVFNDADFIEEVIEHILSQELELVIFDDGSTDGTYEICKKYADRDGVELLRIRHDDWKHTRTFRILYDMALLKSPNWVIRADSDEILESGINGMTLRDAIIKVDSEGFNTIQFDWFEFFLTDHDDESKSKVIDRMKYYSWQFDFLYRAWKVIPGIQPELGWGHIPVFPKHQKYKVYPKKFVARHYRFRSVEQANKKITTINARTRDTTEGIEGNFRHYERIAKSANSFIIDHSNLSKYNDDNNWNLERKFYPYINKIQPTKEEVLNEDGSLKLQIQDISELRLENLQLKQRYSELENRLKNTKSEN